MCRLLVEAGATFDAKDDAGQTPAREAKVIFDAVLGAIGLGYGTMRDIFGRTKSMGA